MVKTRGMALLLLLVLIAIMGLIAASAVQLAQSMQRRQAEEELLVRGLELQRALQSYISASAQPVLGPSSVDELLRDARFPRFKRHLRALRADPMTDQMEWGLVTSPDGRIVGFFSLSNERPIKQTGFDPALVGFENAESYQDWVFGVTPRLDRINKPISVRAR